MSEATPGPWTITELSEEFFLETNHKYAIAGGLTGRIAKVEGLGGESLANARLIAAAPDYAAGVEQMLLNETCGGDGWWKGWEMLKAAHEKARPA